MAIFSRKTVHNVEPPRTGAAGPVQINEYQGLDLSTPNGTYTLKSTRIGETVVVERRAKRGDYEYTSTYIRALTINPEHLDSVIALLTVARDKMVGAR